MAANISKLQKEYDELRTQVLEQNAFKDSISNLFSVNQIKKLQHPDKPVRWSKTEMRNAERIYRAGPNAYQMLLDKKYPFPAVPKLLLWLESCSKRKQKNKLERQREMCERAANLPLHTIEIMSD